MSSKIIISNLTLKRIVYSIISWSLVIITFLYWGYSVSLKILFFSSILISLKMIIDTIRVRNKVLYIVSLFMFLYLFTFKYAIFDDVQLSAYTDFQNLMILYQTLLLHSIFLFSIFLVWNPSRDVDEFVLQTDNKIIWWINFFLCVVIFFLGQKGDSIFSGNGYGNNDLQTSSLNDYALIFMYNMFKFSGKSKFKINVWNLFVILFILKTLLLGSRGFVVLSGLMALILYWQYRLTFKKFFILSLVFIVLLSLFELVRLNPELLLSNNLEELIAGSLENNSNTVLVNNQSEVIYSSMRINGLIENGILSLGDRIFAFLYFILAIILPFSYLPELANLSTYEIGNYPAGGGGLVSAYLNAFGGIVLLIVGGIWVGYILSRYNNFKTESMKGYAILVLSTLPTWFAYYPVGLIKMCLYGAFLTKFFMILNRNMLKSKMLKK